MIAMATYYLPGQLMIPSSNTHIHRLTVLHPSTRSVSLPHLVFVYIILAGVPAIAINI